MNACMHSTYIDTYIHESIHTYIQIGRAHLHGAVGLGPQSLLQQRKQTPSSQSTDNPAATATETGSASEYPFWDEYIKAAMPADDLGKVSKAQGVSGLDWSPQGELVAT
jgi:hypothetical protein